MLTRPWPEPGGLPYGGQGARFKRGPTCSIHDMLEKPDAPYLEKVRLDLLGEASKEKAMQEKSVQTHVMNVSKLSLPWSSTAAPDDVKQSPWF